MPSDEQLAFIFPFAFVVLVASIITVKRHGAQFRKWWLKL